MISISEGKLDFILLIVNEFSSVEKLLLYLSTSAASVEPKTLKDLTPFDSIEMSKLKAEGKYAKSKF